MDQVEYKCTVQNGSDLFHELNRVGCAREAYMCRNEFSFHFIQHHACANPEVYVTVDPDGCDVELDQLYKPVLECSEAATEPLRVILHCCCKGLVL